MRQLKFRIWDNLKKEWISNKSIWRINADERGIGEIFPPSIYFKQHPEGLSIQQFTGLIDQNNKEIYEGDIVCAESSDNKYLSKIVWCEDNARFGAESIAQVRIIKGKEVIPMTTTSFNLTLGCSTWSVVGNIFENPELLN
jgi:uncharacterized phage protein (TIGR01671 family)